MPTRLKKLSFAAVLTASLAIGAALQFATLAKSSIWHDEGYTLMLAVQTPSQIIARTGRDVHPPLYYLALHFWMGLFGTSEAGARSLSVVAILGTVILGALTAKRLFGEPAAKLAAVFLALGPFLIRYGQEARMYGLVAFLLTLATWALVGAVQDRQTRWWVVYGMAMAAALYTHYYSVFMFAVHGLYLLVSSHQPGTGLRNYRPWVSWAGALALFVPWLPTAAAQFGRVQAAFWIPKPSLATLPATLAQFITFTDLGAAPLVLRLAGAAGFAAITAVAIIRAKARANWWLAAAWAGLGPLVVFLLSFKRPIYVDRYFVFAAVGFYVLLAAFVSRLDRRWRMAAAALVVAAFSIGIRNVYAQSNHQMRQLAAIVNPQVCAGDEVISGELYTYFDFSYYNHTGHLLKLLAPDGVTGYGETSLLYDRADQIVVHDYAELHPASGQVWVIGKTGQHDYFSAVPANWQAVGTHYQLGYVAAQQYSVGLPTGTIPSCRVN